MKIQRSGAKPIEPVKASSNMKPVTGSKDAAIDYIKSAIDVLGTSVASMEGSDAVLARDAIANLSVVLLDLKG